MQALRCGGDLTLGFWALIGSSSLYVRGCQLEPTSFYPHRDFQFLKAFNGLFY